MAALLEALYQSGVAEWLRGARWGYAFVNAAHILGIALLIGAIVPLGLRLIGWRRETAPAQLARLLVPVAATGLALAVATGLLLFATRAPEYAALDLFLVKLALVAAGTLHAVSFHLGDGFDRTTARLRVAGIVSILVWPAVLVCGRLLAFVE